MTKEELTTLKKHVEAQLKFQNKAALKLRSFDCSLNLDVANNLIKHLELLEEQNTVKKMKLQIAVDA